MVTARTLDGAGGSIATTTRERDTNPNGVSVDGTNVQAPIAPQDAKLLNCLSRHCH
jgi:hypothetical protein